MKSGHTGFKRGEACQLHPFADLTASASGSDNGQFAVVTHFLPFPFFLCVRVVNCEGEDGRPYLLQLVVVKLKNCFHYQVEGFSHANYQYHCEVAFLLIQTSLSDQKERKIVLVLYQTFCSDNGKSYLMKYCTDHTILPFTAGEKEREQTNGWGWVSLLMVFSLRGFFCWFFFFAFAFAFLFPCGHVS